VLCHSRQGDSREAKSAPGIVSRRQLSDKLAQNLDYDYVGQVGHLTILSGTLQCIMYSVT